MKEKKELMLFILNEEESTEDKGRTEENIEEVLELKQINLANGTEIELTAIHELTSKGTMKLKGELKKKEVDVLIGSGPTTSYTLRL